MADTSSRAVEPDSHYEDSAPLPRDYVEAQTQVCALSVSNPLIDNHYIRIQKETQSDMELQELMKCIKDGWPIDKQNISNVVMPYWNFRTEL